MVILALETVTRAGSIAVWADGACLARVGDAGRTHGERLPIELLHWLEHAGRRLDEVTMFAVVSGPGSFTGMRIGLAAVQGLALASGRQVVPVPTLETLAGTVLEARTHAGTIAACLDGQRGEVYCAAFDCSGAASIDRAAEVLAATVGPPAVIAEELRRVGGPSLTLVGDGARRYESVFTAMLPTAVIVDPPTSMADAAARYAARRPDLAVPPHALRPLYVRRPDAEIARERAARAAVNEETFDRFPIRRAEGDADLAAVASLQRETFTNAWGADAMRWELENTDVARLYLMHDTRGALVAYCACWMMFDELHLNSLAVDPAWRRKGIARHFLRRILQTAAADGAKASTLEVRSSNEAARRLYGALGFVVEGVRRDYYQEPREDALILWKRGL